jgi:outer membrane murein-binding lipoprotein Lpp
VLSLTLLAGCASEQAYKRGDKLAPGANEQAVAELEAAVRLADEKHQTKPPHNAARLAEVKLQADNPLEAQFR